MNKLKYLGDSEKTGILMTEIQVRHLLVLTAAVVLFVLLLSVFTALEKLTPEWAIIPMLAAVSALIVFDVVWLRLPHILTWCLLSAGLARAVVQGGGETASHFVVGATVGAGLFAGLQYYYMRVRGKKGLGGGDTMMFAAIGAWVGWAGLPTVLLVSSLTGAVHFLAATLIRLTVGTSEAGGGAGARATNAGPQVIPYGLHLGLALLYVLIFGTLTSVPYVI